MTSQEERARETAALLAEQSARYRRATAWVASNLTDLTVGTHEDSKAKAYPCPYAVWAVLNLTRSAQTVKKSAVLAERARLLGAGGQETRRAA